MPRKKTYKRWGFGKTMLRNWVDSEVLFEFENICSDIGVDKHVMLNEVLKEFTKEMRKAQKHNMPTIYGDLFPTNGTKK